MSRFISGQVLGPGCIRLVAVKPTFLELVEHMFAGLTCVDSDEERVGKCVSEREILVGMEVCDTIRGKEASASVSTGLDRTHRDVTDLVEMTTRL